MNNIKDYKLKTQKFINSISTVVVFSENSTFAEEAIADVQLVHKYFKNGQNIELEFYDSVNLKRLFEVLNFQKINKFHNDSGFYSNHEIQGKEGLMFIGDNNFSCLINFKNLKLRLRSLGSSIYNEYVMLTQDEIKAMSFDIESILKDSLDYEIFKTDYINEPTIFLLKKYIDRLLMRGDYRIMPCFIPQKQIELELELREYIATNNFIEYLKSGFTSKTQAKIEINGSRGYISEASFKILVESLFKYLNIKKLCIKALETRYTTTSQIYPKIQYCTSLKSVRLDWNEDVEAELNLIGKNPNVVRWDLEIRSDGLSHYVRHKLEKLVSLSNNNTIVRNESFKDIYLSFQLFDVSPISDCYFS